MATLPALNLLPILIVLSCIKVENALQITPDLNGDVKDTPGRAYYGKKFRLWNRKKGRLASFNTTFVINISNKNSPEVGEGLAFVLSADADVPNDSFGQWLGLVNATTNGTSRAGIVGVEFDTRKSYEQEPDGNHVGLDINSCYSIEQRSLSGYGVNLSVGVDVLAVVQYDGKNMTVFVSSRNQTQRSPVPVFSVPINLSLFLPETVHVGFSASTGEFQELNCVRAWEFHGEDIDEDSNLLRVWIFIPILALGLVLGLGFFIHWRRRTRKDDPEKGFQNIEDHIKSSTAPRRFKLRELKRATNNFNQKNKLGKGGFGTVYKGIWKEQESLSKSVEEITSREPRIHSRSHNYRQLKPQNLVKLIGWCYENKELLLVYEYMLNGSLDKFIFYDEKTGKNDEPRQPNLSWETRLIIIQGDFGLARTIQQREKTHHSTIEIAGTLGYMAPETFLISRAAVETDVYSYGVLLIEVVCGRKLGNQSEEIFVEKEVESALILGLACCHPNPHLRPSMKHVLAVLTGEADPPQVPLERPSFVWPALPPAFSHSDYSLTSTQFSTFSEVDGR
ncbi:Ribosomal protein L6 family protein [Hibiscus syriacus]|uniref:Ribosomal protein L6 family protein n=1 Tax=Hibiscus syriacus TaxID=106335 RepID=A0A6A3CYK3_HIBSY|nr:Ribosomal protein L6 family protein [Hibiscus syriacus]